MGYIIYSHDALCGVPRSNYPWVYTLITIVSISNKGILWWWCHYKRSTLNQWFLQIVAVGVLCSPLMSITTVEIFWLQGSDPTIARITHIQHRTSMFLTGWVLGWHAGASQAYCPPSAAPACRPSTRPEGNILVLLPSHLQTDRQSFPAILTQFFTKQKAYWYKCQ